MTRHVAALALAIFAAGCAVGPTYKRPPIAGTPDFEAPPAGWKEAEPNEGILRGRWWEIYNDPHLNELVSKVELSNQNVIAAMAQYREAVDQVQIARAALFPTVTASPSAVVTRGSSLSSRGQLISGKLGRHNRHHRPERLGRERQLRDAVRHLVSGRRVGQHSPKRDGDQRHGTGVSRRPRERKAHVSGTARTDVLPASRSGCGRRSGYGET